MTRQEIEQKMDELEREYHETYDPEIPERRAQARGAQREIREVGREISHRADEQMLHCIFAQWSA